MFPFVRKICSDSGSRKKLSRFGRRQDDLCHGQMPPPARKLDNQDKDSYLWSLVRFQPLGSLSGMNLCHATLKWMCHAFVSGRPRVGCFCSKAFRNERPTTILRAFILRQINMLENRGSLGRVGSVMVCFVPCEMLQLCPGMCESHVRLCLGVRSRQETYGLLDCFGGGTALTQTRFF